MRWRDTWPAREMLADEASMTAQHWTRLLEQIQPDTKARVEATVKRWNLVVRELLRNETGFRLSVDGDVTQVPVRVSPGLPTNLVSVLRDFDRYADLFFDRKAVEDAHSGLGAMLKRYRQWQSFAPSLAVPQGQTAAVHHWLEDILKDLDGLQMEDALRSIDQDCLGAYFFTRPGVEIYWVAIGVIAAITGGSVEGLTVVALAHELAHAYTHLGKDIDGKAWDTEAFAGTELLVVEGLAQYYARVVCRRLDERFPPALTAFDGLVSTQSRIYTDFQTWLQHCKQPGEVVRFTMIHIRTNGILDYGYFRNELEQLRV